MFVTHLSATPGGSATPLQRQEITPPIGDPPLRIFRRTLYLQIPTGGAAESLEIDPAATLRGSFGTLDYDALHVSESSLRATVGSLAGGVVVTLDAPRRVMGFTLQQSAAPTGSRLELYRLDGNTPSGEPTVTAVREEFLATIEMAAVDGGARALGRGPTARASGSPGSGISVGERAETAFGRTAHFSVDFTDARFLLRLKSSSGSSLTLTPSHLQTLSIRSYPSNPRIGLAFPADPDAAADPGTAVFFWRANGEVGTTTPAAEGTVDAGEQLAAELARAAARFTEGAADAAPPGPPPSLPEHLDIALVLESDAPCVLHPPSSGEALRVEVRRVRSSFPDGQAKRVLRFAPGHSSEEVDLDFPGAVALASATISLDVSLSADRSSTSGGGPAVNDFGDGSGVASIPRRRIARKFELAEATSVSSIALPVMAQAADAEATVELRADAGGAPTGTVLATGSLRLERPGRRAWSVLSLPRPVVVSTAPHWLLVSAAAGTVVWLARASDQSVRVLTAGSEGAPEASSQIEGLETLYDLRSRSGAAVAAAPPLQISSGGAAVSLAESGNGFTADLTTALAPVIAAAAAGSLVTIPVRFATADRGVVTVYPPRVVY